MTWTVPFTATTGALSAADWNAYVRDNINELGPAKANIPHSLIVPTMDGSADLVERPTATAHIADTCQTTSTTFADPTDGSPPGPTVTVETSGTMLVILTSHISGDTAGAVILMGFDSGEFGYPPSNGRAVGGTCKTSVDQTSSDAGWEVSYSSAFYLVGPEGSYTLTAKYMCSVDTGIFKHRKIAVLAF